MLFVSNQVWNIIMETLLKRSSCSSIAFPCNFEKAMVEVNRWMRWWAPGWGAEEPLRLSMTHCTARTRSAAELLQHQHPGEIPKPAHCLFVITAFSGLIRQALTLVRGQVLPRGWQDRLHLQPPRLLSSQPKPKHVSSQWLLGIGCSWGSR